MALPLLGLAALKAAPVVAGAALPALRFGRPILERALEARRTAAQRAQVLAQMPTTQISISEAAERSVAPGPLAAAPFQPTGAAMDLRTRLPTPSPSQPISPAAGVYGLTLVTGDRIWLFYLAALAVTSVLYWIFSFSCRESL